MSEIVAVPEDRVNSMVIDRVDDGVRIKMHCQICGLEVYIPSRSVLMVLEYCLMHNRH